MVDFRFRITQLLCSTVGVTLLAATASPARAEGRVTSALITELSVEGLGTDQVGWVRFNQNMGGTRPSCMAPNWANELMFVPTTNQGKVFLVHLQAAMVAKERVDVSGGDTCVNSQAEAISYVKVYAN